MKNPLILTLSLLVLIICQCTMPPPSKPRSRYATQYIDVEETLLLKMGMPKADVRRDLGKPMEVRAGILLENKDVFRLKEELGTEPKMWYFSD